MGSKTKGWGSCVSWVWGPTPRKVTRASGAWALDPDPTGLCAPGDVTQNTQLSTDCPTYKSSLEEAAGGGGGVFCVSPPAPPGFCSFLPGFRPPAPPPLSECCSICICFGELREMPRRKGVRQQNLFY